MADMTREPRQPMRLEKKKNTGIASFVLPDPGGLARPDLAACPTRKPVPPEPPGSAATASCSQSLTDDRIVCAQAGFPPLRHQNR
jgi:hypothetical protein